MSNDLSATTGAIGSSPDSLAAFGALLAPPQTTNCLTQRVLSSVFGNDLSITRDDGDLAFRLVPTVWQSVVLASFGSVSSQLAPFLAMISVAICLFACRGCNGHGCPRWRSCLTSPLTTYRRWSTSSLAWPLQSCSTWHATVRVSCIDAACTRSNWITQSVGNDVE